jgi:hypothetical protein
MKVTRREKRLIVVGAVVIAASLIFYALTLLLPNRETLAQNVELKKKMLIRERAILSQEGTYKNRLEEYSKHLKQDLDRLLPGDNPNVAGAELQKILQSFADKSGVEITQKNILQEKEVQGGLVKISVRIETNCDPEQLVQLLTAIENYEKFLTIDEFTVSSFRVQREYRIRPSLTVSGFIDSQVEKGGEESAGALFEAARIPGNHPLLFVYGRTERSI